MVAVKSDLFQNILLEAVNESFDIYLETLKKILFGNS